MLVSLFKAIVELADKAASANQRPKIIEHAGQYYWDTEVEAGPIKRPVPPTLVLTTLQGLFEYVDSGIETDSVEMEEKFIRIESPSTVVLHSGLNGADARRLTLAQVNAMLPRHSFGEYLPQDAFIIGLQSRFVQDENLLALIKAVSTVMSEAKAEVSDDGVSQTVNAKAGIVLKDRIALPNPVVLRPYRTFHEVEQPASRFILRVNAEGKFTLYEADGGAWRTEAMGNVAAWLQKKIDASLTIEKLPILA